MTDTTTVLVLPITRQDKRALLHSDSICFTLYNGRATIRADRNGANTADGFDAQHIIYVDGSVHEYFNDGGGQNRALTDYSAFYLTHLYSEATRTLVNRLSVGDTVVLKWTRSNNNDSQRAIGWNRDDLHIVIRKPKGKDETYLVTSQVGPDNSARMIKKAGRL